MNWRILPLALALLFGSSVSSSVVRANKPRISKKRTRRRIDLARLIGTISSVKSSALTVARALGARAKSATALRLAREPLDTRYPALSLPGDLPKRDYPNRAALTLPITLLGRAASAHVLSELRVLTDVARRRELLGSTKGRIVVLLAFAAKTHSSGVPRSRVVRALRKIGARAMASGHLGVCERKREWCYTEMRVIDAHRGHYRVHVHLELSRSAADAGARLRGIKIVRWP